MQLNKFYLDSQTACVVLETHKLDMSNAADFKKKISALVENETQMVLDMAQVEFVDSSGLGAILSFLRDLRTRGGELRLCCVQPRVMAMFELVRMHKIIPLLATREEAMGIQNLPNAA
jgi:anti-sigma B factor antagonist